MNGQYKPKRLTISIKIPISVYPDGHFTFDPHDVEDAIVAKDRQADACWRCGGLDAIPGIRPKEFCVCDTDPAGGSGLESHK